MITNAVRLLIICVFAFVPLLLGEFARNKAVNNTNDFILQGRKLKTFPMYATIFSTWMSIFAFIGAIAYFYEQGPIYMTTGRMGRAGLPYFLSCWDAGSGITAKCITI